MNLENIIVCAICLVAIAIVGYFMYTKVTAQNQEVVQALQGVARQLR